VNFSGLEVLPAENALEGLRGITCERVHFDLENTDTRGVRTLTSPHMTPAADMIEYLVDASEKIKHDIAEPQAASRPPRWVALEPGKLVLEEAA
jgi:hypothetical protein